MPEAGPWWNVQMSPDLTHRSPEELTPEDSQAIGDLARRAARGVMAAFAGTASGGELALPEQALLPEAAVAGLWKLAQAARLVA